MLRVLVLVGTTEFDKLIEGVIDVVNALVTKDPGAKGICKCQLIIQYGRAQKLGHFIGRLSSMSEIRIKLHDPGSLDDWPETILRPYELHFISYIRNLPAVLAKADKVICHAGAGCLVDSMKLHRDVFAVSNPKLLGNHQCEIGNALSGLKKIRFLDGTELWEDPAKMTREVTEWLDSESPHTYDVEAIETSAALARDFLRQEIIRVLNHDVFVEGGSQQTPASG